MKFKKESCILPHCDSSTKTDPELLFYSFPEKDERLRVWLRVLQLEEVTDVDWSKARICENHFSSKYKNTKKLKRFAIPTLNLKDVGGETKVVKKEVDEEQCSVCSMDEVQLRKKCQQLARKIDNQKRKNSETLCQVRLLNMTLAKEKKKRANILAPSRKNRIPRLIHHVGHISEATKTLCSMLMKNRHSWEDSEKALAVEIYKLSDRTYKLMRDDLEMNLPSDSTIQRWLADEKKIDLAEQCIEMLEE